MRTDAAATALEAPSTPKRLRSECDTASQAIVLDSAQSHLSLRPSPRKALAVSQVIEPPTFISELRNSQVEEAIIPPTDGSKAATVATTEAAHEAVDEPFNCGFADNLDGIAWERLPDAFVSQALHQDRVQAGSVDLATASRRAKI